MKRLLLLVLLALTVKFSTALYEFQSCTKEVKEIKKPELCKITKFKANASTPNAAKFYECVLSRLEYYNHRDKELYQNGEYIARGLSRFGMSKEDALKAIKKCKDSSSGGAVTPIGYVLCLLKDGKTKNSFQQLMKSRDEDFFKSQCKK
uniref:Putative short d7 salivary protein n=1 Tax=Psorophora albipes TaxID=869069 RepID=T1DIZ4_9DIPT